MGADSVGELDETLISRCPLIRIKSTGLIDCASGHVDEFVAGHLALLDQIDHRQQPCPFLDRNSTSFCSLPLPIC